MGMISAEVICDSISPQGYRLTTFKLRYPKFIHGEFMTHRVISRNASSSRAIPTKKLLEEVRSDALRASPVFWGQNQAGMQAAEELSNIPYAKHMSERNDVELLSPLAYVQDTWREAALDAAVHAETMLAHGAHKQIVNRILEPFSHINVIATATEWENFFGLRLHKDAQPEMKALALAMWNARQKSTPELLRIGKWHLPFVDIAEFILPENAKLIDTRAAVKVSVARCARVSYESFETGKRSTIEEDLKLYDRLLGAQPLHASPAEHQATPDQELRGPSRFYKDEGEAIGWAFAKQHGNFVGWRQYRKMLPGEAVAPLPEGFP